MKGMQSMMMHDGVWMQAWCQEGMQKDFHKAAKKEVRISIYVLHNTFLFPLVCGVWRLPSVKCEVEHGLGVHARTGLAGARRMQVL